MKCDDCLNSLEEFIDGELAGDDLEQVNNHLVVCQHCSIQLESMTAEKEVYARYDRELEIAPSMWQAIAARTESESRAVDSQSRPGFREWFAGLFAAPRFRYAFSGAFAVAVIAVVVGVIYLRTHQQQPKPIDIVASSIDVVTPPDKTGGVIPAPPSEVNKPEIGSDGVQVKVAAKTNPRVMPKAADDPGVLYSDVAYSELAERDTAEHIKQSENLLRSMRSLQASDDVSEIDVSYEKAMSRRLLEENMVLRRDAEEAGKFPVKELLKDLEPFLTEIANLPDKTTATQLREFKDRVQKTEIVAALVSYED